MLLIYGKWKVGTWLAHLCRYLNLTFQICDDSDAPEDLSTFESIIPSPWIPGSHRVYNEPNVICELDFVSQYIPDGFKKISVTGTDGKSTTCHMITQLLKHSVGGIPVYLTGNSDTPFSQTLTWIFQKWETEGILVIEVSSFMAYIQKQFLSHVTILTNLHPDHLDWHDGLLDYYHAKLHLLYLTSDTVIVPDSLFGSVDAFETLASNTIICNKNDATSNKVQIPQILVGDATFNLASTRFRWYYNASNMLMALLAIDALGIDISGIQPALDKLKPLDHRVQEIHVSTDNVHWIEDGKSTTSQAQIAALDAMPDGKTLLIAGGKDKWDDFSKVDALWKQKCSFVAIIWEISPLLAKKAKNLDIEHATFNTLEDALISCHQQAQPWDHILFSPGCSSFDMFDNYLDRAKKFHELTRKIISG